MMEENNRIWILMARVLGNEASPEDHSELLNLLENNPELEQQYNSLNKLWQANNNADSGFAANNNQQIQRILNKGSQERAVLKDQAVDKLQVKTGYSIIAYTKYAAAAILILVAGWFFIDQNLLLKNQEHAKEQVLTVKNGSMTKVVLSDGTQVWLNSGSKLFYPNHFTGNTRHVKLLGEAFFDVFKDKHHPFIVTTTSFNLKVLGTAFNVRSYLNDNTSEAALVRGKIEVTLINQPDKKIILRPSEKLTVKNSYSSLKAGQGDLNSSSEKTALISLSTIHQSAHDSLPTEALWLENKLVFDEEPFESIAHKMERRYNVSIVFKNNAIKKESFTGKFYNESVYKVLQSLQTIESFNFNIKNNQVTIY